MVDARQAGLLMGLRQLRDTEAVARSAAELTAAALRSGSRSAACSRSRWREAQTRLSLCRAGPETAAKRPERAIQVPRFALNAPLSSGEGLAAILATSHLLGDDRSTWFEGALLLTVYVILALAFSLLP
jgi:hypothetical protein